MAQDNGQSLPLWARQDLGRPAAIKRCPWLLIGRSTRSSVGGRTDPRHLARDRPGRLWQAGVRALVDRASRGDLTVATILAVIAGNRRPAADARVEVQGRAAPPGPLLVLVAETVNDTPAAGEPVRGRERL